MEEQNPAGGREEAAGPHRGANAEEGEPRELPQSRDEICFSKISRERARLFQMTVIMEECEASTDVLQSQVDEARERSQRELDELRRQLQEKASELDKSRQAAKRLQDEVR